MRKSITLLNGEPGLSRWQSIFLCEFDGPRSDRRVITASHCIHKRQLLQTRSVIARNADSSTDISRSDRCLFGPQCGALGFDHLASVGAGFEIDTSAHSGIISRARLVGRYVFGDNVSGFSIGLAASF